MFRADGVGGRSCLLTPVEGGAGFYNLEEATHDMPLSLIMNATLSSGMAISADRHRLDVEERREGERWRGQVEASIRFFCGSLSEILRLQNSVLQTALRITRCRE